MMKSILWLRKQLDKEKKKAFATHIIEKRLLPFIYVELLKTYKKNSKMTKNTNRWFTGRGCRCKCMCKYYDVGKSFSVPVKGKGLSHFTLTFFVISSPPV